ncbi:reverse transcriptase domain-containing protein [Tanacetum coccineum]
MTATLQKGTEGVVELTQWFERMETVFRISNCSVENQIKFSTYLRKKMTDKYCPRNEIKKLEAELWNLKVKGTDVTGYNQRFQELALLCVRMFPEESDKVESLEKQEKTDTTTKLNNKNFPRGRMWSKLTPLGLVKEKSMPELYHYATSANFTNNHGRLHCKMRNCRGRQLTRGLLELLLLTIKEP